LDHGYLPLVAVGGLCQDAERVKRTLARRRRQVAARRLATRRAGHGPTVVLDHIFQVALASGPAVGGMARAGGRDGVLLLLGFGLALLGGGFGRWVGARTVPGQVTPVETRKGTLGPEVACAASVLGEEEANPRVVLFVVF